MPSKKKPESIQDATISAIKKGMVIETFGVSAEMMSSITTSAQDVLEGRGEYASKLPPDSFNCPEGRAWLDQAVVDIGNEFKKRDIPLRLDTPMKVKAMKGCFYYLRQNRTKRKWKHRINENKSTESWTTNADNFRALSTLSKGSNGAAPASVNRQATLAGRSSVLQPGAVGQPAGVLSSAVAEAPPPLPSAEGPSNQARSLSSTPTGVIASQNSTAPLKYARVITECRCSSGPATIMEHTRIQLQNHRGRVIDSCLATEITGFNTRNPHFLEDQAFVSLQGLIMDVYDNLDPKGFRFEWWDPVDQEPKAVTSARHLRLAVQTMLSCTANEFVLFRCSPRLIDKIRWEDQSPSTTSLVNEAQHTAAKRPSESRDTEVPTAKRTRTDLNYFQMSTGGTNYADKYTTGNSEPVMEDRDNVSNVASKEPSLAPSARASDYQRFSIVESVEDIAGTLQQARKDDKEEQTPPIPHDTSGNENTGTPYSPPVDAQRPDVSQNAGTRRSLQTAGESQHPKCDNRDETGSPVSRLEVGSTNMLGETPSPTEVAEQAASEPKLVFEDSAIAAGTRQESEKLRIGAPDSPKYEASVGPSSESDFEIDLEAIRARLAEQASKAKNGRN